MTATTNPKPARAAKRDLFAELSEGMARGAREAEVLDAARPVASGLREPAG